MCTVTYELLYLICLLVLVNKKRITRFNSYNFCLKKIKIIYYNVIYNIQLDVLHHVSSQSIHY